VLAVFKIGIIVLKDGVGKSEERFAEGSGEVTF